MRPIVYIMMFGWPIIALIVFYYFHPSKAVLISLFAGWLLLPQADFPLSGLPDYSRTAAVLLGVVLGVLIFDSNRLAHFHFKRVDIPIIVFCMCPMASSLSNGLGLYDGISGVITATINFGIPYYVGRLYFADRFGTRELAVGLIIAVLCYTPLILYEYRMSPQLHRLVYGYLQIKFHMIWRLGWYRPMVFLRHGLELGVLVASAAMTTVWMWRSTVITKIGWMPLKIAVFTLVIVCALCRAVNGYFVLLAGLGALYLAKIFNARSVILLLILLPPAYIFGRLATDWDAANLVEIVESVYPERAHSLQSRISHEITLIEKALQRPLLGWGGYARNRSDHLADGAMGKRSVTDSLWIIVLGKRGLIGLVCLGFILLRPIVRIVRRFPISSWSRPDIAPAIALSMVLLGFTFDCLFNAMYSPVYFVIAGGLSGLQPTMTPTKMPQKPIDSTNRLDFA
jgi:hypothetical protein